MQTLRNALVALRARMEALTEENALAKAGPGEAAITSMRVAASRLDRCVGSPGSGDVPGVTYTRFGRPQTITNAILSKGNVGFGRRTNARPLGKAVSGWSLTAA